MEVDPSPPPAEGHIVQTMTRHSGCVGLENHVETDSFYPDRAYTTVSMHGLWAGRAGSLLDVVTEVRGRPRDVGRSRFPCTPIRARGPAWPGILTRLRGIEAALLQDVVWWGPVMEEKLQVWTDEQEFPSHKRSVAAR
jgi:hypothetical protein